MGLRTPIDRHYRFGELFGIRSSYYSMSESIDNKKLEETYYNAIISYLIESGDLEKIERFAKKNRTLCDFAQKNAITEAVSHADLSTSSLNIPKIIKLTAEKKARMAVSDKANSIKTNSYKFPTFNEQISEPTIFESLEDYVNTDDNDKINELIMSVAKEKGILGNKSKKNELSEEKPEDLHAEIKHNYSIQSVIIEGIAGNERRTSLIPPTKVFEETQTDNRTFLNSTIKQVTDGINAICGINFTENDYIWLSSGRPVPHFKGEIAVNSDLVKGNRLLNTYFGPAGQYKDYLYKPDGTPRIEPSKSKSMSDVDKDINVIQSYPIIKVYATIVSWDNVNGRDTLREITEDDFYGTAIKFVR